MIPRRLRLHNFLSYRDCSVDFSGLHLATLCGKNGDGKSALLDAMTWAVWGKARGKDEESRIHADAPEMAVEFDFASGGDTYRIVRKRTRGRSTGEMHLFQVSVDGEVTALTGNSIRDTQKHLVELIRLDYETFTNSAFVVQGRANEFSNRTPSERKEVLRKVLGLELYETLSTAANDRKKDATRDLKEARRRIEELEAEICKLPRVMEDLERIGCERAALVPRLEGARVRAAELRAAAAHFEQLKRLAEEAETRLARLQASHREAEVEVDGVEKELTAIAQALGTAAEVTAAHGRLVEIRKDEGELARVRDRADELQRALDIAAREIAIEEARIRSEAATIDRECADLARAAEALPSLQADNESLEAERTAIEAELRRGDELRSHAAQRTSEADVHGTRAEAARQQAQELKERQEQITGAGSQCPVCLQPLSAHDAARVRDEFAARRKELGASYHASKAAEQAARTQAAQLAKESEAAREAVRERGTRLEAAARDVHARTRAAEDAAEALPSRLAVRDRLHDAIETGGFALEPRARKSELAAQLDALAYDRDAHEQLRAALAAADAVEKAFRELAVASEREAAARDRHARLLASLARLQCDIEEATAGRLRASEALASCEDVDGGLRQAEGEEAALRAEEQSLAIALGRAEEERRNLAEVQAHHAIAIDNIRAQAEEEEIYGDLARAFGRDGVQAMLMDQAIPELERVANTMLDLMTGGRIAVTMRTQRRTAKGTAQETLDIDISDEIGTRDYDMYSGGEAFRVDFALRIALAKLLAVRAGSAMPTLIIDEGFGSQDQDGIDRLVEALEAIRDEFELILVVTHVEEMRDRFERRIEVTKDPVRGSLARVV